MTNPLLVLTTFPDIDTAQRLAKQIVQAKLAACVNILPQAQSIYMWQGEQCMDTECIALIKTTENNYPELESCIQKTHPYELPEIIATPITKGSASYLSWLSMSLKNEVV